MIISKEQSTRETTQAKKDVDMGASEQVAVKKQDQASTARSKEKAERRTCSKYVLLVKEQTEDNKKIEDKQKMQEEEEEAKNTKQVMDEVTKEIEEVEQSNNEEGQTYEEVEETKEEEKTRECGTIYSYAITEGSNMKSGDTNKHSTLFH